MSKPARKYQQVPRWASRLFKRMHRLLRVTDRVELRMRPADPATDYQGQAEVRPALAHHIIDLPYDTYDNRNGRETLLHEILHCMQYDYFAARDTVLKMLPEAQREAAKAVLDLPNERFVERLSWAINDLLTDLAAAEKRAKSRPKKPPKTPPKS